MSGPVNDKNTADQIAKLYELHKSGALTGDEFEKAKLRALGDSQPVATSMSPFDNATEPDTPTSPVRRGILIICGLIVALIVIGGIFGDTSGDDDDPTPTPVLAQSRIEPTVVASPTATAIPRTGIQTIRLSITVQDDWKAWGEGCVGSGPADWISADNGVAVAPSTETGTAQGQVLGTGVLSEDEARCQWSATITSRASDAYAIAFDGNKIICHSNTMLPTDDGFFAAVVVADGELQCASVVDVQDATPTTD